MKLRDLFINEKQIADTSGKKEVNSVQNNTQVSRQIHALVPGQTLKGEVVARNGNEVSVKLSEEVTIKARLEQNMHLEVGKTITFEVKNNGHSLFLSPLYTNVATDANVLKALDMASLPITDNNIEMTELMMRAGLSVDRNSLQQVFRECSQYSNADMADVVDLHKLSIPVNENNLVQINVYKNLKHQLITGLEKCMDALPDTIQQMVQSGDVAGAEKLCRELFYLIQETPTVIQSADGQLWVFPPAAEEQAQQEQTIPGQVQSLPEQQMDVTGQKPTEVLPQQGQNPLEALMQQGQNSPDALPQQGQDSLDALPQQGQNPMEAQVTPGQNPQEVQTQQGRTPTEPQMSQGQILREGMVPQSVLQTDEKALSLSDYLKMNLQKTWTILPEEVSDFKQVEKLYQRLNKQLKSLEQMLESVKQTNTESYRTVVSLSRNIDFMQQLNQAYTFVQLPLRLQQGKNAHGELFVYTNKKHLAAKEGQISALLHLDMAHLGPLDVYVAMQNQKVNTKFYLQDEEMLDFLGEHMELLTERLKARGYDYQCEMVTRNDGEEKARSSIQQILKANGHVPMAQYAFDVRT